MAYVPMTRFEDHRTPEGKIDWASYDRAKVANGEKCTHCGGFILSHRGRPTRCSECASLDADPEVQHHSKLRCPECGASWDASGMEDGDAYREGEHPVSCPECDHGFEFSVSIQYTYTSPAKIRHDAAAEGEETTEST